MLPNIIIFRIEDQDGSKTFVELPMDENGIIDTAQSFSFQVLDGDSYNLLGFDQLILAHNPGTEVDGQTGSYELARIDIFDHVTNLPVVIHEGLENMAGMAIHLMNEWKSGEAADQGDSDTDPLAAQP